MSSKQIFIDTEFTSFQQPEGLSIGIITDDAREFYAEADLRKGLGSKLLKRCDKFVLTEVISQFRQRPHAISEPASIGPRLADWLIKLKAPELEVYYDYSTDFELFQRWLHSAPAAHKAPKLVPMHVAYLLGQEDALRAQEDSWRASESADGLRRHHSLADARALRQAFRSVHGVTAKPDVSSAACGAVDIESTWYATTRALDAASTELLEEKGVKRTLLAEDGLDDSLRVPADAPLVFLDIDDVVCLSTKHGGHDAVASVKGQHMHPDIVYAALLHLPAVRVLQNLHDVMRGQLRYVITSTWRRDLNRSQMVEVLQLSGLHFVAERIERRDRWSTVDWPHRTRLNEIAHWLERFWRGEPFVVIDDDYSGQALVAARDAPHGPFRGRIVLCKEGVGLLPEHLPQLLEALYAKPSQVAIQLGTVANGPRHP